MVIAGAGIIGCAIAYELSRRGVSCLLLDSRKLGLAATNAAAGILAPPRGFRRAGALGGPRRPADRGGGRRPRADAGNATERRARRLLVDDARGGLGGVDETVSERHPSSPVVVYI